MREITYRALRWHKRGLKNASATDLKHLILRRRRDQQIISKIGSVVKSNWPGA
jgi:hypothetical protein